MAGEAEGAVAEDAADEVAFEALTGVEQRPDGREVEEEAEGPGVAAGGGHGPILCRGRDRNRGDLPRDTAILAGKSRKGNNECRNTEA